MIELLEDPPYKEELPNPGSNCEPLCTNSSTVWCLTGFQPLSEKTHILNKYTVESNGWKWVQIAGNPQTLTNFDGSQGPIDVKYGWQGSKKSGILKINIKINNYKKQKNNNQNYLFIQRPYSDWNALKELTDKFGEWLHVKIGLFVFILFCLIYLCQHKKTQSIFFCNKLKKDDTTQHHTKQYKQTKTVAIKN